MTEIGDSDTYAVDWLPASMSNSSSELETDTNPASTSAGTSGNIVTRSGVGDPVGMIMDGILAAKLAGTISSHAKVLWSKQKFGARESSAGIDSGRDSSPAPSGSGDFVTMLGNGALDKNAGS